MALPDAPECRGVDPVAMMRRHSSGPSAGQDTRLYIGLVVAVVLVAADARAQGPVADTTRAEVPDTVASAPRRAWAVSAWGGFGRNSPDNIWGAEPGRDVAVTALRIGWPMVRTAGVAVDYVIDLVPAAWVSMLRAPTYVVAPCSHRPSGPECTVRTYYGNGDAARGFGAAPVGLEARFRPGAAVQPYTTIGVGLLRFSRPVPIDGAATLNITADLGGGALVAMPGAFRLMIGYKFYHISNGGSASQNPGIDSHMMVVGLRRGR